MAHAAHGHPTGYRQYFMTWFWLLVMTLLALALGYINMPGGLKAVLLVGITLGKIVLIGSIFMHLRFERLNLVMLTFSPLILALIAVISIIALIYLGTQISDKLSVIGDAL